MGALFGSRPEPPKPPPRTPMPDIEDPAAIEAKRRAILQAQARSGRMSTVLSDSYDRETTGGR